MRIYDASTVFGIPVYHQNKNGSHAHRTLTSPIKMCLSASIRHSYPGRLFLYPRKHVTSDRAHSLFRVACKTTWRFPTSPTYCTRIPCLRPARHMRGVYKTLRGRSLSALTQHSPLSPFSAFSPLCLHVCTLDLSRFVRGLSDRDTIQQKSDCCFVHRPQNDPYTWPGGLSPSLSTQPSPF